MMNPWDVIGWIVVGGMLIVAILVLIDFIIFMYNDARNEKRRNHHDSHNQRFFH